MSSWTTFIARLMRVGGRSKQARLTPTIVGVALALAAAWRLWALHGASAAPAYETQPIVLGVIERSISATGAVKALVTVDVGSRLSGIVSEVKVNFNDQVKEGDVLAVIDRAPFQAKLDFAVASLAAARATVELQEALLGKSQKQFAHEERDASRFRGMARAGSASRIQLDQAETQSALAKDEMAVGAAQLAAARASVVKSEADARQAQLDLDYTLIRSPIGGVVIDRKIQQGQTVAAAYQTPLLFQIARDLSQILIFAQVDEADIGGVRAGDAAQFTVDAYPDETFDGVVEQVRLASTKTAVEAANGATATQAPASGGPITYTVVVTAQNPGKRLFPDMTATVRIVTAKRENARLVPNEALKFHPEGHKDTGGAKKPGPDSGFVWIADTNGELRQRSVRFGLKGDVSTEIVEGDVKPGELVALRAKGGK